MAKIKQTSDTNKRKPNDVTCSDEGKKNDVKPTSTLTPRLFVYRNAVGRIELEVVASEDVQDSKNQVSIFWYFKA